MKNENKIFELMRINSPYKIFSKKLNSTTQKNKL